VQSIDRDLNYSAPAYLWLRVVTPWYANQWILLPVCALVAILGAGTIVSTWRYVVKHRESQLAQVRVQAQEAFSRDILDQQEEERKRIAAELHDSLGQTLLVLKNRALLGLRSLANPSRLESQLTEISDNASQAITETRQIAFNLRPHQLDSLGLDRGIQAMANKMCQAADLKLVADLDDVSGLLTPAQQTHIFRIVQESLNNVVKHAKATRVMVTLKRRENELHLRIEDNGVGISNGRKDPRSLGGSGRANIAKRVDYLNGVLRTESDPDRGTTIDITIPLPEPVES
jgi:signal transduction histidine kinase